MWIRVPPSGWDSRRRVSATIGPTCLVNQVKRSSHDGIGINAKVAIKLIRGAGLSKIGDSEARGWHSVNPSEERKGVWMPVDHGNEWYRSVARKEHVENPGV